MYFRFLLEKIASRIHEQQLQQELVGIVERERRPLADYLQLQNEVAKAKQHPSDVGFMSLLLGSKNVQRADVCMFNEEWTEAYRTVMAKRVSDDVFRIMSVRLLEPLVFECIQFSLNLFNNNSTVIREAKMASKESEELEKLRATLQATANQFNVEIDDAPEDDA